MALPSRSASPLEDSTKQDTKKVTPIILLTAVSKSKQMGL
jgi:hypothetical protein